MSRREKLIDSARPYLEADEEVRYVVGGQTGAPQGLLGAMAIVAGKAKQRRVVVTDSSIYVLEGDFWGTSRSKSLVARHEIGSVPVAYHGRALTIGDERMWVHPFAQGDAEQIGSLTSKSGP
jgi:hypothetical protein